MTHSQAYNYCLCLVKYTWAPITMPVTEERTECIEGVHKTDEIKSSNIRRSLLSGCDRNKESIDGLFQL